MRTKVLTAPLLFFMLVFHALTVRTSKSCVSIAVCSKLANAICPR